MDVSPQGLVIPGSEPYVSNGPDLQVIGDVFTKRWVVDWLLDLAGYRTDLPLFDLVIVEPSCGDGAFIQAIVQRLLEACERFGFDPLLLGDDVVVAGDVNPESVERSRAVARLALVEGGVPVVKASALAVAWIVQTDFLLDLPDPVGADFVVGNPPYVRLEDVPNDLVVSYRASCATMKGRSDLFVGFFERGLVHLKPGGTLAYICADRWMRNSYGRSLRRFVVDNGDVATHIQLHDVDCFDDDVAAYPAITTIRKKGADLDPVRPVVVETNQLFGPDTVADVNAAVSSGSRLVERESFFAARLDHWFTQESWPEGHPDELSLLDRLEASFESLEDPWRQTRIGIGVATGADRVFITSDPDLVEEQRMLPLLMSEHIKDGHLKWTPRYLVNPWDSEGLCDLDKYPRFSDYVVSHEDGLRGRHTAKKTPAKWFRTIDRVHPWLTGTPKIVFADMKARMTPVVDDGLYYPHHNLYWLTSTVWDLRVLAGLLLSDQAELFVRAYCVKMRGGTLRMQAQYLRRIRVPRPDVLSSRHNDGFREAYATRDRLLATQLAAEVYDV